MTRLCELAEKYRSDKVVSIFHDYTPFYDALLQGREVKRVLEIGIGTPSIMSHVSEYEAGASLRMWRDYFPDADIYGLDRELEAMIDNEPRIITMLCDQSSRDSLSETSAKLLASTGCEKFDLIVDDGSHWYEDQALTANVFVPSLLSPTGVYVIEDVLRRDDLSIRLSVPFEIKIFNIDRIADDCIFYIEGSKI